LTFYGTYYSVFFRSFSRSSLPTRVVYTSAAWRSFGAAGRFFCSF